MRKDNQDEILIEVKGVSKKFSRSLKRSMLYGLKDLASTLLGIKGNRSALREGEFWAVRDVSFSLRRGECLGLIGRNGAGKSTLLKMLNGLIRPDEGSITMRGKIGALIELGAGFNPLLTGRENIYVNAQLLGFSRKEINEKFQAILDFAEIGEFIDSPVQNYSSGMKVRLGFAVAAQMEPDIMLIDEVLAVGDLGFAYKCYNKIDELQSKTAFIFVSHNMPQISRMSNVLMVMSKGRQQYYDQDVSSGISNFYEQFDQNTGVLQFSNQAELVDVSLSSYGNNSIKGETFRINHGEELNVHLRIKINIPVVNPTIGLSFLDKEQRPFGEAVNFSDYLVFDTAVGSLSVIASFSNIQFGQGIYSISILMRDMISGHRHTVFRIQSAIFFSVLSKTTTWTPMEFKPVWSNAD